MELPWSVDGSNILLMGNARTPAEAEFYWLLQQCRKEASERAESTVGVGLFDGDPANGGRRVPGWAATAKMDRDVLKQLWERGHYWPNPNGGYVKHPDGYYVLDPGKVTIPPYDVSSP
jgi:hypothetical protein